MHFPHHPANVSKARVIIWILKIQDPHLRLGPEHSVINKWIILKVDSG